MVILYKVNFNYIRVIRNSNNIDMSLTQHPQYNNLPPQPPPMERQQPNLGKRKKPSIDTSYPYTDDSAKQQKSSEYDKPLNNNPVSPMESQRTDTGYTTVESIGSSILHSPASSQGSSLYSPTHSQLPSPASSPFSGQGFPPVTPFITNPIRTPLQRQPPNNSSILTEVNTFFHINNFMSGIEENDARIPPMYKEYLIKITPLLQSFPDIVNNIEIHNNNSSSTDQPTEDKTELTNQCITMQKVSNFVKSELLFRGNKLLYLLYLEIYPYLDDEQYEYDEYVDDAIEMTGGRVNLDALNNVTTPPNTEGYNTGIRLIYSLKLLAELHHDFKGFGKTLKDLDAIVDLYNANIAKISQGTTIPADLTPFRDSLMAGHGEWHFFKCTLDYLTDKGLLDELTIIKYRSVTSVNGAKDYYLIDMDGNPVTEPLFEKGEFDVRYPDNSTCDSALSKLLRDADLDWKPKLIIQNAPSLTDPATIGFIDVSKFYPVVSEDADKKLFNFQKCQDLNNYFDPFNKIIVKIMCQGINAFFNLFGGSYTNTVNDDLEVTDAATYTAAYNAAPIKFIVMGSDRTTKITPTTESQEYITYLQGANTQSPNDKQFYYSGIVIKPVEGPGTPETEYELRVGDTTIKNITKLVNSNYVSTFSSQSLQTTQEEQSWFRLCSLANYIKSTIPETDNRFNLNGQAEDVTMVLKFLIVCLKALGDWFQVFYVSSIHYRCLPTNTDVFATQFKDLVKYLSSSDKNTIADMMIHSITDNQENALRFLGNGFCIKPSENLYKRFPGFFENPAIPPSEGYGADFGTSIEQVSKESEVPPEGKDNQENEDVDDGAGVGSLKGIFLNFQKRGEDLNGKVIKQLEIVKGVFNSINNESDKVIFISIVDEQSKLLTEPTGITELLNNLFNAENANGVEQLMNGQNVETLKKIKQSLTRIPLVYQMLTGKLDELEKDVNALIELSEKEQKSIFKISELKRDLTSDEIANLDTVYAVSKSEELKRKLDAKMQKILGSSSFLSDRINQFTQKIATKVDETRTKMSTFFGKIKAKFGQATAQRTGRRTTIKSFGIVDFIRKHDPIFSRQPPATVGGRRRARRTFKNHPKRTIKNKKNKVVQKKSGIKSFKKRVGVKYKNRMTRIKK